MKGLTTKKRLAAQILKVGENKIWLDKSRLDEIKEAITRADIRSLINDKAIQAKKDSKQSGVRRRKRIVQKRKGRQKGPGSRKGKKTSRMSKKNLWMIKIRNQRDLLKKLKSKKLISIQDYGIAYRKAKGGFFRSRRHLKLFLEEQGLLKKNERIQKKTAGKNRL